MTDDIDISQNSRDRITALARGGLGAIPFVGSALAELVTEIIPNQRLDRVEKYLLFLTEELDKRKLTKEEIQNEFSAFLIEEGIFQSARAITDQRRKLIAHSVAEGITQEQKDKLRERKILDRLGELDDDEILILDAHGDRENSWEKFANIRPAPNVIGASNDVHEQNLFYEAAHEKLERLGLLNFRINVDFDTKLPNFDQFSGRPKGYHTITRLGELILERIGLNKFPQSDKPELDI